jgi:hypothetical protein
LYYLDDERLSKGTALKYIQILSFLGMFLLCISFMYDNIISTNIILNVGDVNNEIGTKMSNSVNLQGNVHVNDKEAGKTVAYQVGLAGAMLGLGKAIAKSPMPPLQKAGVMVGTYALGGLFSVGLNKFDNNLSKKIHPSGTNNITSITPSNAKVNSNISKFVDDSQSDSIQDIF